MDFTTIFSLKYLFCNKCINENFCEIRKHNNIKNMVCIGSFFEAGLKTTYVFQNKKGIPVYYVPKK